MTKIKNAFFFALGILPISIAAGIFAGHYQLGILSDEMIAQFVAQGGSSDLLILVSAVQTTAYSLFCCFFGYILADKLGLWKSLRFEKKKLAVTLAVSVICGVLFSLDHWIFGGMIQGIREANAASLTISGVVASILYGGIIEELMLRLFFMSLIAWIIRIIFCRKYTRENIPSGVFIAANFIAALTFAAGHLPATAALFGELTPLILFRCFLLNGGFGILFGWLYRKYGIVYSMLSHATLHIISKLIWFIFV